MRGRRTAYLVLYLGASMLIFQSGCQTPAQYRGEADRVAGNIIMQKQQEALNKKEPFSIERPRDILRRRLLLEQGLPYQGDASLGTDKLKPAEHWPEQDYPRVDALPDRLIAIEKGKPLDLSLAQSLQIGAGNNYDYQTYKENIFRAALDLDLERNVFRNIFSGQAEGLLNRDLSGQDAVTGGQGKGSLGLSKTLQSGAKVTALVAMDLVKLLTQDRASSFGIVGDATMTIPLLRGAGRHVVTEPLTQAERNVIYTFWEFDRFRKVLAVDVYRGYLDVLRRKNQIDNAAENYRNLIGSTRRTRRMADAGRATEVEVNQSLQNELQARNRWVSAREAYKSRTDTFKRLLGLPPDAEISLDYNELDRLFSLYTSELMESIKHEAAHVAKEKVPPADEPIELAEPSRLNAGPFEVDPAIGIGLAIEHRLDLRVAEGKVYDAQRRIPIAADALRAELTFFGRASMGEGRTLSSANLERAQLRTDKGSYSAWLTLDLPFERTAERNNYRISFIALERALREMQKLEDEIKLDVRNRLRVMYEARESRKVQARALFVAETRVKSTALFFEAGRISIRDLLEAQDALLAAKNSLASAVVDYRVAELEFQRDAGVLQMDVNGLWQEYAPERLTNGNQK